MNIPLETLETKSEVHSTLDLLDDRGRKPVGGKLEVFVRLREPLTGGCGREGGRVGGREGGGREGGREGWRKEGRKDGGRREGHSGKGNVSVKTVNTRGGPTGS